MPGNPSLTAFAGQVPPWSLGSLDTNFTNIAALLKDVGNYSPYVADTGAANAYVVTFAGTLTYSLNAGTGLFFKATNANTGASTLNANGTGAKNILNVDGSSLAPGQIPANSIVQVMYDGAQYLFLGAWQKGWQLLSTGIASASATLDFTGLTGFSSYMFVIQNIVPVTNSVTFQLRVGNAGVYEAANYIHTRFVVTSAGTSGIGASGADTKIVVADPVGNFATEGVSGTVLVPRFDDAMFHQIVFDNAYFDGTNLNRGMGMGLPGASAAAKDCARFLFSSGNIATGTIKCYGLRG